MTDKIFKALYLWAGINQAHLKNEKRGLLVRASNRPVSKKQQISLSALLLDLLYCEDNEDNSNLAIPTEVITLTPETFSDKVKEKDTACKNLGTLWEEVGKAMEGEDEIEVGEVDCAASKSICSKVDIHSYPTFKVFYDGEGVAKYQDLAEEKKGNETIMKRRSRTMKEHLEQFVVLHLAGGINSSNNEYVFPELNMQLRSSLNLKMLAALGPRDVESLKAFVLDEAEKAAAKAHLDNDKDL
ncbi:unnamed protein product [Dovyalis caffra]|uniref:Thioredoxin domain-containing protein n=1 Tax=Dovyalis caffra TaxID=77055 RepID=A0AAV1RER0_9ROSI|nr:unnamed protein product [Dovyalis caffra]